MLSGAWPYHLEEPLISNSILKGIKELTFSVATSHTGIYLLSGVGDLVEMSSRFFGDGVTHRDTIRVHGIKFPAR